MSTRFGVGDRVFVPSRLLPNPDQRPSALTEAHVVANQARSVVTDLVDAAGDPIIVPTRLLHGSNLGVAILRIGDIATEATTLDPLAKSTLQYLRLLLPDDHIRLYNVRTSIELQQVWQRDAPNTSHVVLIGHGNEDSIRLLDCTESVGARDFAQMLRDADSTALDRVFISMSCLTGRKAFAKDFSADPVCSEFIAPFQSVHSAAASLFAQAFFANHLLSGMGVLAAHRHGRRAVGAGVSFRLWRDGHLVARDTE